MLYTYSTQFTQSHLKEEQSAIKLVSVETFQKSVQEMSDYGKVRWAEMMIIVFRWALVPVSTVICGKEVDLWY